MCIHGSEPTALHSTSRANGGTQTRSSLVTEQSKQSAWMRLQDTSFQIPYSSLSSRTTAADSRVQPFIAHQPPSMEPAQHSRTPFFSCLSDLRREKIESVLLQLWSTVSHSSSYDHSKRSNNWINKLLAGIRKLLLSSPKACSLLPSSFMYYNRIFWVEKDLLRSCCPTFLLWARPSSSRSDNLKAHDTTY